MTSTNEGGSQSGFDPGKSGFEFFKELIQSPLLYFFSVGGFFIAFALAGNIPWVGKLPTWGTVILLIIGGALVVISVQTSIKSQKDKNRLNGLRQDFAQLDNALKVEQTTSNAIRESVNQAILLLEGKKNKDQTDLQVLEILQAKTIQILLELQGSPNHTLTADWFEGRQNQWINYIKEFNYEFLDTKDKRTQFFEDIEKHLNLLCTNLRQDVYRTPKVEGLTKSSKDSSLYVRVFKDLRTKILVETENDKDILQHAGINYLNTHIDAFIALINS